METGNPFLAESTSSRANLNDSKVPNPAKLSHRPNGGLGAIAVIKPTPIQRQETHHSGRCLDNRRDQFNPVYSPNCCEQKKPQVDGRP